MVLLDNIISENVFKFVTGLFFALATITAISRTVIRYHLYRRFQADDYLLFFALACFIASSGLLYKILPTIYLSSSLKSSTTISAGTLTHLARTAEWFKQRYHAYFIVNWAAIFAVKGAFLAFFKRLVRKLGAIYLYWKIVVVVTAVSFIYCVVDGFIACPQEGVKAVACSRPPLLARSTALTALATALDIATELMIVVIPLWILKIYQRSPQQKLGMGVFLCLNVIQAIVAIIRMIGIQSRFTLDHTWNDFWQQIESSIAISMVSITAFRSFFVTERTRRRERRRWYYSSDRYRTTPKKGFSWSSSSGRARSEPEELRPLPQIPSATLTGMRTFIRNDGLESQWLPEPDSSGDLESQIEDRRSPLARNVVKYR